jgi:hypothetical protein
MKNVLFASRFNKKSVTFLDKVAPAFYEAPRHVDVWGEWM